MRSPDQKPSHRDFKHNDYDPVIALERTYAPASNRAGSRSPLDWYLHYRCFSAPRQHVYQTFKQ